MSLLGFDAPGRLALGEGILVPAVTDTVLNASAGSYGLTGSAVTFDVTGLTILSAAAGSYAVTGNAATFSATTSALTPDAGFGYGSVNLRLDMLSPSEVILGADLVYALNPADGATQTYRGQTSGITATLPGGFS